ncbi:MAG: chemotaxis protein CheW [Algisphaera sp.]
MNDDTLTHLDELDDAPEAEFSQVVSFWIGKEEYAIDVLCVREINRLMAITHVPNTVEEVLGVVNLRGTIIPVIDLRAWFRLGETGFRPDNRIIIIEVNSRMLGCVVERVNEVIRIDPATVDPPGTVVRGSDAEFISGVARLKERLLMMLDVDRVLEEAEGPLAQMAA